MKNIPAYRNNFLTNPQYDPNLLLDYVGKTLKSKNDRQLSIKLGIRPPVISKIRNRHTNISAEVLVRIHEVTEIPIKDLKKLMRVS